MHNYYDKYNNLIKEGMLLKHDNGEIDLVVKSIDGNLGFNATNKNWIGYNYYPEEIYPLSNFNLMEFEIIGEKEKYSF